MTIAPLHEGGPRKNRGLAIPPNLKLAPERRLTIGYTASNSYTNRSFLVCRDRSCQLDYESDHVGNLYSIDYVQPFLNRFEIAFSVGRYRIGEPAAFSPVHRLAGDSVLRHFHENVIDEPSLPVLSGAPDGRQVFSMTDLDGRRLTLRPEHAYRLPMRVGLIRYFDLKRGEAARLGLNAGLHVTYPLEGDLNPGRGERAFARGLDVGVSINLIRVKRLTDKVSATFHLQAARFESDVRVVNPTSPLNSDDTRRSQYALTYGLRFAGTFGGNAPCSFSIGQRSSSAHYDKDIHFAFDPVVFEGGNNLRGALSGANDYGAVSFGCEYKRRHYQIMLAEDIAGFSQLIGDDGAGTSYDPDFAIGLSITWMLSSRVR